MLALQLLPLALPVSFIEGPGDRVEEYLERCETFGWSGVALVELDGRIILHRGFGMADRAAGRPNEQNTVFEVASTTKPVTAAAILSLVKEGKLDLDESIATLLPSVPESRRGITVRHLLSHTSGMPRRAVGGGGDDLAAAVRGYLSAEPVREPGADHEYWNGGYALLAGIIETVTGESYQEACDARLFRPLRLERTGFTGDAIWEAKDQAMAYAEGAPVRLAAGHAYGSSYHYGYRGMGGLVTSAEELWKLGHAIIGGELLGDELTDEMLTEVDGSYGLGWGVAQTRRGTSSVSHGGDVRGFHTQLRYFPEEKAAIVVLSNVDEPSMVHVAWNLESVLFEQSLGYPHPPAVERWKEKDLDRFVGSYGEGDQTFEVERSGSALVVRSSSLQFAPVLRGQAPSLEAQALADRCVSLMRSLAEGDSKPIAEILAGHIPESWPSTLVASIWPAHVATHGALHGIEPVSCSQDHGVDTCVLALDHEGGRAYVRISMSRGRLRVLDLKASAPDPSVRFAPSAAEGKSKRGRPRGDVEFVTHIWSKDWRPVQGATLRFKPARGKVKRMVIESPGLSKTLELTR